MIRLFVFVILILLVLHVSVSPLFAKAPTTPKILFTSARDGNYEIYIMNPDGSEQVNLTQHRAADLDAVWAPPVVIRFFSSPIAMVFEICI